MNRTMVFLRMTVAVAALSVAQSYAQMPADQARTDTTTAQYRTDDGTNWSWLGLIGLVGLAGLVRNRQNDRLDIPSTSRS